MIKSIQDKSNTIQNFDPNKYIVWDKVNRGYKEAKDLKDYKQEIFK